MSFVSHKRPQQLARRVRPVILISAIVASMLLAGCSRSGPPRVATHPTKGSISFQGQPIGGAFLVLHPKDAKPDVPTPRAHVQPDGSFVFSTYDSSDGAPGGDYVVTVQWQKPVKAGSDFLPGPNLLPPKYSNPATSGVIVTIAAGQNNLPPITLRR